MDGKAGIPKMVTDEQQWYVQKGSRVQGPFTTTEVGRYLLLGRVRNTDRVSKDGELWEPVTQVPELIPEELLDLDSETGWQSYLASHRTEDERRDGPAVVQPNERRNFDVLATKESVRQDWKAAPSEERRAVSMLPLTLLGVTLLALLLVIYMNTTSGNL